MSRTSIRTEIITEAMQKLLWAYNRGTFRYMDEFIKQYKSAADLLLLGIYPNAKEITESYGALNAVRTRLKQYDLADQNVTLISVGDGKTPSTAALFAFKTAWNCISIDPNLDQNKIPLWEGQIKRLHCVSRKVEDCKNSITYNKLVIVGVHSHAPIEAILQNLKGKERSLVAIPCCIPYEYTKSPCKTYTDAGINSPKNLVKVWKAI
jgi:hypothetical protein